MDELLTNLMNIVDTWSKIGSGEIYSKLKKLTTDDTYVNSLVNEWIKNNPYSDLK